MLFGTGILGVVIILYALSLTGTKAPKIPPDMTHASITIAADCQGCHSPGKSSPLKKAHPPKDQCFECHKRGLAGQHGIVK
ncbi:MAG: hypothetical protein ABSG42_03725 [Nitrospirota bacterium]